MTITPLQRRLALGFALAVTIAVTLVFGENSPPPAEPVVVAAVAPSKLNRPAVAKPVRIEIEKLSRMPPSTGGPDLFAPKSWAPPRAVVQPRAAPVPAPAAPPLPFEYVGQMEGRDGLVAYLAREGEFLSAKAGDQLGGDYRLESVAPDVLTFVYLPLAERQMLPARVP